MKHYMDVWGNHSDNVTHTLGKLFRCAHGYMNNTGKSLGLAFPEMTPDQPGGKMRIFGDQADLEALLASAGMAFLLKAKLVSFDGVQPVPESVSEYRSYQRDRANQRRGERAIEKQMVRIIKHYKKQHGSDMPAYKQDEALRRLKRKCETLPFIWYQSASNGHLARIFIRSTPATQMAGAGDMSGFGLSQHADKGLPVF